jgi:hypothetical protein
LLEKIGAANDKLIEDSKAYANQETKPDLEESGRANDQLIKASQDYAHGKAPTAGTPESPAHTPGLLEKSGATNDKFIQTTQAYANQDTKPDLAESGRANDELIKASQDYAQDKAPTAGTPKSPAHTPGLLEKSGAANDKFIQTTKDYANQDTKPDLAESGRANDQLIKASQDYAHGKAPTAGTPASHAHTPGLLEQTGAANDKFIQTTKAYANQDTKPGQLEETGSDIDAFMHMCDAYAHGESIPTESVDNVSTQPVRTAPTRTPTPHPISVELRSTMSGLDALMAKLEQMWEQSRHAMEAMPMLQARQVAHALQGHVSDGAADSLRSNMLRADPMRAQLNGLRQISQEIGGSLGLLPKLLSKAMGKLEMLQDPPRLAEMKSAAHSVLEPIMDQLRSKLGSIEHMLSRQTLAHLQRHPHFGMNAGTSPMLTDAGRAALSSIGTDIKLTMRKLDKMVERLDGGTASVTSAALRPALQKMEEMTKA